MLINNTRYQILEVLFSLPTEKEKRKEKKIYQLQMSSQNVNIKLQMSTDVAATDFSSK